MRSKVLGAAAGLGLLATVTGCADAGPDRVLTEEEMLGIFPSGDEAPGSLEMGRDISVHETDDSREQWEASLESSISSTEDRAAEILDEQDPPEYAEECAAALEDSIDTYQELIDSAPDNADFQMVTADAAYQAVSWSGVGVFLHSMDPDTSPLPDRWLDEALACMGTEGQFPHASEEIEETSLGDAAGYQSRLPEGSDEWRTVLYAGSDYLLVTIVIESDEPVDGELADEVEALLDHIAEQASAIDG